MTLSHMGAPKIDQRATSLPRYLHYLLRDCEAQLLSPSSHRCHLRLSGDCLRGAPLHLHHIPLLVGCRVKYIYLDLSVPVRRRTAEAKHSFSWHS